MPEQDFIAERAAAEPGSLFGLIQRNRNKPLIDALMSASGEMLTHPAWDFMLGTKVHTPESAMKTLRGMGELAKEAKDIVYPNIVGYPGTAVRNKIAKLFMQTEYPWFSNLGFIREAPQARVAEIAALPPLTKGEGIPIATISDVPKSIEDAVSAIASEMNRIRQVYKGTSKSPKAKFNQQRAGELASASFEKFYKLVEDLYGSANLSKIFQTFE